jgi:Fe-Mn family superoxide dismutase
LAHEPSIPARTNGFHHGEHHETYVETLNKLIAGTEFEGQSLESIIKATHKDEAKKKMLNNAGQVWNHDFIWKSLDPKGGKLTLKKPPNAENMLTGKGCSALLTIDVWERAYYLDQQNKRPDFLSAAIDKLLNWRFAEQSLG